MVSKEKKNVIPIDFKILMYNNRRYSYYIYLGLASAAYVYHRGGRL